MYQIIIVIHILLGLGIIGLILMQHGKGADAGATFGGGASGSVFGAQGAGTFLSRTTAMLATAFFITSLGLAWMSGHTQKTTTDIMSAPENEKAVPEIAIPETDTGKQNVVSPESPVAPAPNSNETAAPVSPAPASTETTAEQPVMAAPLTTPIPAAEEPPETKHGQSNVEDKKVEQPQDNQKVEEKQSEDKTNQAEKPPTKTKAHPKKKKSSAKKE